MTPYLMVIIMDYRWYTSEIMKDSPNWPAALKYNAANSIARLLHQKLEFQSLDYVYKY